MIGLDTNILVRYIAQDDPIQSSKATEIIERRLTEENPGFLSTVAMIETVWVLERAYRLKSDELAAIIERILQIDVLSDPCGPPAPRESHEARSLTWPCRAPGC